MGEMLDGGQPTGLPESNRMQFELLEIELGKLYDELDGPWEPGAAELDAEVAQMAEQLHGQIDPEDRSVPTPDGRVDPELLKGAPAKMQSDHDWLVETATNALRARRQERLQARINAVLTDMQKADPSQIVPLDS